MVFMKYNWLLGDIFTVSVHCIMLTGFTERMGFWEQ